MKEENKKIRRKLVYLWIILGLILIIVVAAYFSIKFQLNNITNIIASQHFIDKEISANFESIKTRFSDLYIWFGFFVTLIIGAFAINFVNATNTAKSVAERELQDIKDKFKNEFENIEMIKLEIDEMKQDVQNILESVKSSSQETLNL